MKTLCVIDEQHNITRTWLFRVDDDADPVEAIRKEFESDPGPEDWSYLKDTAEWFYLKRSVGATLKSISWPKYMSPTHEGIKAAIYRRFAVRKVSVVAALAELDNDIMEQAIANGWTPPTLTTALDGLAWAMSESDQAEAYRESVMDMLEDIEEAIQATEAFYENDASEFLESDHADSSEPKDPSDMSVDCLLAEAERLHKATRGITTYVVVVSDAVKLAALEKELITRGYSILIGNETYTIEKKGGIDNGGTLSVSTNRV